MKKLSILLTTLSLAACGLQVRDPAAGGNNTGGLPNTSGTSFTVGGTAVGIPYRKDVKVTVNGDDFTVDQNGSFTFPQTFPFNSTYDVVIVEGPGGGYTCTLENESGVVRGNVNDILLTCDCVPGSVGTGAGTSIDPIRVYTATQLNDVALSGSATQFSKKYKQVCDLDYAGMAPKPVGRESNPFTGDYNGNGFFILNYKSDQNVPSLERRKGVFGFTNGSTLENINLADFIVTADANMGTTGAPAQMGALVGTARETYIEDVFAENINVDNNGSYFHGLGGLVGNQIRNDGGSQVPTEGLKNIHVNSVDVTGGESNKVSCVVGWTQVNARQVQVRNSNVHSCDFRCGSVAGAIFNKATFSDINAQNVSVEGDENVGGVVGESFGTIIRAASVGTVNGVTTAGRFGGIIGAGTNTDPVTDSYTVTDILSVAGTTAAGRITGSTASLIQNTGFDNTQTCQNCTVNSGTANGGSNAFKNASHASMASWNFNTIWCEIEDSFPSLATVPFSRCE